MSIGIIVIGSPLKGFGLKAKASISGYPARSVGLTAEPSGWGDATLTYQWNRDGTLIAGATSSTYTLVEADVGSDITVTVSNGTKEVTSDPVVDIMDYITWESKSVYWSNTRVNWNHPSGA